MPTLRLRSSLFSPTKLPLRCRCEQRVSFANTSRAESSDPSTNLADAISPSKAPKPDFQPVPSRPATEFSDSRNPMMQGYPDPNTGKRTTSTATPDTTTPEPPSDNSPYPQTQYSNPAAQMNKSLNPYLSGPGPKPAYQTRQPSRAENTLRSVSYQEQRAVEMQARAVEQHMSRVWRDGDVYSPHDLSWVEQQKARYARMVGHKSQLKPLNSRRHGTKDVLDELGINPIHEYKNFAMLGEFVSEMGRIKHSRETGLRAVNQRKMAKAVRRAIGIGILPSVHKHPELLTERKVQRGFILEYRKS